MERKEVVVHSPIWFDGSILSPGTYTNNEKLFEMAKNSNSPLISYTDYSKVIDNVEKNIVNNDEQLLDNDEELEYTAFISKEEFATYTAKEQVSYLQTLSEIDDEELFDELYNTALSYEEVVKKTARTRYEELLAEFND